MSHTDKHQADLNISLACRQPNGSRASPVSKGIDQQTARLTDWHITVIRGRSKSYNSLLLLTPYYTIFTAQLKKNENTQ